jgi:prepilin-type processing-associated H-X9-DG protein
MKQRNPDSQKLVRNSDRLERSTDTAFTRLELVVLISVVGFWVLLLTPAFARSRAGDRSWQCQNNLRQLVAGWRLYTADNEDHVATAFSWVRGGLGYDGHPDNTNVTYLTGSLLWPYVNELSAFKCPADRSTSLGGTAGQPRTRSYSMNHAFRTHASEHWSAPPWRIYRKASDMVKPAPARLWVFLDEHPDSINDAAFAVQMDKQGDEAVWNDMPSSYHNGTGMVSFGDGHTENHKWHDLRTLYRVTYSQRFPYILAQPNNPDIAWVQEGTTAK